MLESVREYISLVAEIKKYGLEKRILPVMKFIGRSFFIVNKSEAY